MHKQRRVLILQHIYMPQQKTPFLKNPLLSATRAVCIPNMDTCLHTIPIAPYNR